MRALLPFSQRKISTRNLLSRIILNKAKKIYCVFNCVFFFFISLTIFSYFDSLERMKASVKHKLDIRGLVRGVMFLARSFLASSNESRQLFQCTCAELKHFTYTHPKSPCLKANCLFALSKIEMTKLSTKKRTNMDNYVI